MTRYTFIMITYRKFITFILPWVLLALIMNIMRLFMTDVQSYIYMNWNLLLALLPILFLFFFERTRNLYKKGFYFFGWLLFLPNAPYMVTDLIHLRDVGPQWMLWYDAMMIFSYALIGIYILVYSLLKMKKQLFQNINYQKIFVVIVAIVSSFGIYLGRYIRLSTWEILTQPIYFAENVVEILKTQYFNPVFVITLIFFSFFILVSMESMKNIFKKES